MEHTLNIDQKYITPIDFPDYPAIESFLDECTNDVAQEFLDTHRRDYVFSPEVHGGLAS